MQVDPNTTIMIYEKKILAVNVSGGLAPFACLSMFASIKEYGKMGEGNDCVNAVTFLFALATFICLN